MSLLVTLLHINATNVTTLLLGSGMSIDVTFFEEQSYFTPQTPLQGERHIEPSLDVHVPVPNSVPVPNVLFIKSYTFAALIDGFLQGFLVGLA